MEPNKKQLVTTGGAGYIPSFPINPNPYSGSLKDIAYRIMSQSPGQRRNLYNVIEGVLQSVASQPYPENRYTGSSTWYTADGAPHLDRDLNYLVAFGNTKNQFEPTKITGFDYSDFLKKNYGVPTMPAYKGQIINTSKINIPTEYKPLVEFLADRPNLHYYDDEFAAEGYGNDEIDDGTYPFKVIDDVAAYRRSFRRNNKGDAELAAQDLIDYKGNYGDKYGTIAGLQGKVLTSVINSPVLLDQSIPVNYTDDYKDYMYGDGWYYTLHNFVNKNHILQKGNDGYIYPLVLPEVTIKPRNKTPKIEHTIERVYKTIKPKKNTTR